MWRKAVTLEELSLMTDEQVMMKINEFLIPANRAGGPAKADDLVGAQFYMAELDRRNARLIEQHRQAAEAERDRIENKRHGINLTIEIAVLVLIAFELIFAVFEGHAQYALLNNLERSTSDTASMLAALQAVSELNGPCLLSHNG